MISVITALYAEGGKRVLDLIKKERKSTKPKFDPTYEQTLAIGHTGSDLLLSAGAGSGKTATLTDRIVERITRKENPMDISRMLVVTYTKDAANELKTRISEKISEKLTQNPSDPHLCDQFIKVTSADISTIHSFCLKCIRPYFDKFDLDSGMRIGETQELNLLKAEAMNEVIDQFYEADTVDPDFLLVVDCYSSYTKDESLTKSLLDLHTKELSSCAEGIEVLKRNYDTGSDFFETLHGQVLLNHVKRIVTHFTPLLKALYAEAISDINNKKYVKNLAELLRVYSSLSDALSKPTYEGIKTILHSYSHAKPAGATSVDTTFDLNYLDHVRGDAYENIKTLKADYFYTDNATIKSTFVQNQKICNAIYKVLKAYEEKYQEKKHKYALCDFDDLEKFTLALFYEDGKISKIAETVRAQYDEIYIDEYQDVNSLQDKIFQAISNNNRFMVGDIKQSIYGFRSAEPELFSGYRDSFVPYGEAEDDYKGGQTIYMSDNFRCDPSIISLSNHVSDYMFEKSHGFNYVPSGDRLKHSKKYVDKDGNEINVTFKNAKLCIIDNSNIPSDSYLKLDDTNPQAEFVAQEIRRLLDHGKLPNGEKIKEKHIAILLRKYKGHADKYIAALEKYGIKHEFEQEVNFFEKPHVLLMISILNSIDNPSKDTYLAGTLHSHIFKFSLDDLIAIKRFSPDARSLYSALLNYKENGTNTTLRKKASKFLEKLENYRTLIRKMNACEAISCILNETGFVSSCNKEERQDILKLYSIARNYEQGSFKGLYSFLRHVDSISEKGGLSETVTKDPNNSVKILTMHKSKGLEYEVCFLCDLEKRYFNERLTPDILFSRKLGICGYISRDGGVVKYNNLIRRCVDLAKKDEDKEEAMRILYVAMTRAKSLLYLTASVDGLSEKNKLKAYRSTPDEYILYSQESHIDLIMGACAYPLSFLDEMMALSEKDIYKYKGVSDDNGGDDGEATDYKSILKKRLGFKYKYRQLEKIPSKLSISTLHPDVLDDEDNAEQQKKYTKKALPEFALSEAKSTDDAEKLSKSKNATGAERGTATHVFLQFCDFKNLKENGFENERNRLIEKSFISKGVGSIIEEDFIEKFRNSKMMEEFLNAKSIVREFRFNAFFPANEFTQEKDSGLSKEKILVQGITDCIYETKDGELILVDYKTDNVPEKTHADDLISKHKDQLTYYKRALNQMLEPFNRTISRVYIYSVPYADMILLP